MIAMHTDKPFLQVENLGKAFTPGAPPVFDRVHLSIDSGEFARVIGHSGCGKTTILNILAGLDEASGGNVFSIMIRSFTKYTITWWTSWCIGRRRYRAKRCPTTGCRRR
jgi:ABC-type oligopeptide transport system ATPase subunit